MDSLDKQEQLQKATFERASEMLRNGDPRTAEKICQNGLADFPGDGNLLCLSARALVLLGQHDYAEERLLTAMDRLPNFPRPYVIRGDMRATRGKMQEAIADFRRAVELGDKDPDTHLKLGKALMMMGDKAGAKAAIDESMRLDPDRKLIAQAYELEQSGKAKEAEQIYREILRRDPGNVEAMRLLAGIATSLNQHRDAEVLLERVLELAPDFGRALADLVNNQVEQEKLAAAVDNASRLVKLSPDNPDSHLLRGNAYGTAGQYEDAIDAYRRSLALSPKHAGALSGLANSLKTIGRQDEAIEVFRKCIELNPLYAETYWSLANLKTFRFSDKEVDDMRSLLERPNIPAGAQIHLHNALGLELERREEFASAFEHFEACNTLQREQEYYDSAETEFLNDRIIEVFDEALFDRVEASGKFEKRPIFIVGLPRSGSTLIEQILASHSHVEGTHELSDLPRVIRVIPQLTGLEGRFPDPLKEATAEQFEVLGNAYMERTSKYRSGQAFFTDKNPNNFSHVGLIHLALPDAVVIDARRHPLDSCLGSYKQLFAKGHNFSYDIEDLAEYYLQYERLMQHWDGVLPGKVLQVRYESVVSDLENEVRRILEHCGLPFEEQCLRFHETDRAVKTASSEQVRKPIYASSVDLWRNYEQELEPLIELLAGILRKFPDDRKPKSLL